MSQVLQPVGSQRRPGSHASLARRNLVTRGVPLNHLVGRRFTIGEVLFEGHQFTKENPVSQAMQHVLDVLNEANLDKESKDLDKFYASVQMRAKGITDPQAKHEGFAFFRLVKETTVEGFYSSRIGLMDVSMGQAQVRCYANRVAQIRR